jgi:hypothetical protein
MHVKSDGSEVRKTFRCKHTIYEYPDSIYTTKIDALYLETCSIWSIEAE